MISFVHAEPEVTLKVGCVVYSDDNLFPHTRNCLTNMIFLHALCRLRRLETFGAAVDVFTFQRIHFRIYRTMQNTNARAVISSVNVAKFNIVVNY